MGKRIAIVAAILVIAALFGGCGEQSERNRIGASIDWGDGFYWNASSESVERPLGADKKRRALGRPARAFSCGGNVKNFGSGKSRLQGGLPMVQYNVA